MKKIIIPTDFSEHAKKAYSVAAQIAKKSNMEIELYSITRSHFLEYTGLSVYNISQAIKDNLLDEEMIATKLESHAQLPVFDGVKITTKAVMKAQGDLSELIYQHINNGTYGLAVMGTEGAEKHADTFAEIIAQHTAIPIITVKQDLKDFNPEKILICTDFENISLGYLHRIKRVLQGFDTQLTLLYINTPTNFKDSEGIERAFRSFKRTYHLPDANFEHYDAYNVEDGLRKFLKKNKYDMLALSTHGRVGLSHFFKGSLTEDMVNESDIPVFSYNMHNYNTQMNEGSGYSFAATRGFTG